LNGLKSSPIYECYIQQMWHHYFINLFYFVRHNSRDVLLYFRFGITNGLNIVVAKSSTFEGSCVSTSRISLFNSHHLLYHQPISYWHVSGVVTPPSGSLRRWWDLRHWLSLRCHCHHGGLQRSSWPRTPSSVEPPSSYRKNDIKNEGEAISSCLRSPRHALGLNYENTYIPKNKIRAMYINAKYDVKL
jgi:hypothetical protein